MKRTSTTSHVESSSPSPAISFSNKVDYLNYRIYYLQKNILHTFKAPVQVLKLRKDAVGLKNIHSEEVSLLVQRLKEIAASFDKETVGSTNYKFDKVEGVPFVKLDNKTKLFDINRKPRTFETLPNDTHLTYVSLKIMAIMMNDADKMTFMVHIHQMKEADGASEEEEEDCEEACIF